MQVHKNVSMHNVGTRDDVEKCYASNRQLQGQDSIIAERSEARAS